MDTNKACNKCQNHDKIIADSEPDWSWGMTEAQERNAIANHQMNIADRKRHVEADHG